MTGRAGLALVASLLALSGCQRQPDVLVILVDTLRYDRLGCGESVGAVPVLEELVADGACFDRVASTAGWTLPTETSMFVSAYPEEHHVANRNMAVDDAMVPITAPLADKGYLTAMFSGNKLVSHPQYQPYFDHLWIIDLDNEFAPDVDAQVVDQALDWIDEEVSDEPLFLVLQLYGPHFPYCPPGTTDATVEVDGVDGGVIDLCSVEDMDLVRQAEEIDPFPAELSQRMEDLYDQEIEVTSVQLERFMEGWSERRKKRRQLAVVLTDHGEAFGEHGRVFHGRSLHQESASSHMAFSGLDVAPAVVDRPVEMLDLAPTLISLLDLQAPDEWRGVDLSSLFTDPQQAFQARAYQVSQLVSPEAHRAVTLEGADGHRYRLLDWEETGERELYDVTMDPLEQQDLLDDPAVAQVQADLDAFLYEMIATASTGGPPRE